MCRRSRARRAPRRSSSTRSTPFTRRASRSCSPAIGRPKRWPGWQSAFATASRWGLCAELALPGPPNADGAPVANGCGGHRGACTTPRALKEIAGLVLGNVRRLQGAMTRVAAFSSMLSEPITPVPGAPRARPAPAEDSPGSAGRFRRCGLAQRPGDPGGRLLRVRRLPRRPPLDQAQARGLSRPAARDVSQPPADLALTLRRSLTSSTAITPPSSTPSELCPHGSSRGRHDRALHRTRELLAPGSTSKD